jgi:hypothetical protein
MTKLLVAFRNFAKAPRKNTLKKKKKSAALSWNSTRMTQNCDAIQNVWFRNMRIRVSGSQHVRVNSRS